MPCIHQFDTQGGEIEATNEIINYTSVGEHEFVVPYDGLYKLEAWGAQDGSYEKIGGYGGYTSGLIELSEGEKIYTYVGQTGGNVTNSTFNGGGQSATQYNARAGGGSTDFRLLKGSTYSEISSLASRIMVAGGGGGSDYYNSVSSSGGAAGGLTAYNGGYATGASWEVYELSTGGTQVSGGNGGNGASRGGTGSFGLGGASTNNHGGGGGYYGGGSGSYNSGVVGSGAGGSSFISGHTGSVAIASESSITPRVGTNSGVCSTGTSDNLCSIHYSNKKFSDTVMIDGSGYSWSNVKGNQSQMPNPNGGSYSLGVGHSGNGYARITFLTSAKEVIYLEQYNELPTPTREFYSFVGWNTKSDGTGEFINSNTKVTNYNSHTLYAIWDSWEFNVSYSVNGGIINSMTTDSSTTYNRTTNNDIISLNGNSNFYSADDLSSIDLYNYNDTNFMNISKNGYGVADDSEWICLDGCKVDNSVYDQDITYEYSDFCDENSSSCNIVLGVNWKEVYTISYDANGGSGAPASQQKIHGVTAYISDVVPVRDSYIFFGWSTSSTATTSSYTSGSEFTINDNITLYAVWIQSPIYSYSCANGSAGSEPYFLTYSGNCTVIDDGDGNWRVKFLSAGTNTLTFTANMQIDAFLVGGGGGGGYTTTEKNISIQSDENYVITIGSGGGGGGGTGGTTSAFDFSARGGGGNNKGSGGSGGSNGGQGGGTTCEFGEGTASGCTKGTSYAYAGGGGGGGGGQAGGAGGVRGGGSGGRGYKDYSHPGNGGTGAANTGGGGGGGGQLILEDEPSYGGSGIVVIRNAR